MKKSVFLRTLSCLLAALMLMSVFAAIPVAAAGSAGAAAEEGNDDDLAIGSFRSVEEIRKFLGTQSYLDYAIKHKNDPVGSKTVTVRAAEYDREQTDAAVQVKSDYEGMKGDSLYTPNEGNVTWKVNIPTTGRYAVRITYFPEEGTYTTIERIFYVDGQLPFSESRYYYFPRVWGYEYNENGEFDTDRNGNDIRPIRSEAPAWQTYFLRDWLGFTEEPFEYYLTAGEHTITFQATREPMTISTIEFYPYQDAPKFDDWLADMKAKGVKEITDFDAVKIQAENPTAVSNACLYPKNDRTSSLTEPQDPAVIKYNYLDANKVNQWMQYEVEVPESGLYKIVCRFRQNDLLGMFTSRRLYINGEIQFKEAERLRYKYSPDWQVTVCNNGTEEFLFYLEKGKNILTFEAVLGDMADYVYDIVTMVDELNEAYQSILMLTGPTPDAYRDYGFNRLVPEAIVTIGNAADKLYAMVDELAAMTGELGDQVKTLDTTAILFETMAQSEYQIAPNLVSFKNYIIALSNWLYAALNQPIKMDYFAVMGTEEPLPQAKSNFFQSAVFEIRAFIMSFFMDYTTIGFKSDVVYDPDKTVEMWIANATSGRDDALIQRGLIDTYFTPQSGISVTIKVISAGLTEAILAGIGPDVSNMDATNTITWGLRHAVEDMNKFDGFDEVMTWFSDAARTPLTMYGTTYGLPNSIQFYMLFYRTDVFVELGLDVPTTWNDLYDLIPALQNSNMQLSVPTDALKGLEIFLYQSGVDLYRDNGLRINLDDNKALDCFENYTDLFSKYKSPVVEDVTRFRTGEIPIMIADGIGTYNDLMGYYELRGLWEMAPLLSTVREDGTLDCTSPATVTSYVIPRGATNPAATWEYLKWMVSEETQVLQAKEALAVAPNPTFKFSTANTNAMLKLAWTDFERKAIERQLASLVGIPEYPGCYIITTYVSSAFMDVYSNSSDAATQMQDRVLYINKEISRKRREFHMNYYDLNSTQNGEWRLVDGEINVDING